MHDRGFLLHPLTFLYGLAVRFRRFLYWTQVLRPFRPKALTISIGNIAVGGTGKTPMVIHLARELGGEVAVLSRGYKSRGEWKAPQQVREDDSAMDVGDEPLLIKRSVSTAEVWVGKKRWLAARQTKAPVVILDDGMQHFRVARDFDLVVVDGKDPLAGGLLLPRGNLREPPHALSRADLILAIDGPAEEVRSHSRAPIVQFRRVVELSAVKGEKVALFCGLGRPQQFFDLVSTEADVTEHWFLPDHQCPSEKALLAFAHRVKQQGAKLLVCTQKDFVKLPTMDLPLPLTPLPLELELVAGRDEWNRFLAKLQ